MYIYYNNFIIYYNNFIQFADYYFVSDALNYLYDLISIISNKYILIILITTVYLSYHSINERLSYSSFTSDNHNDLILSKFVKFILNQSKFSLHIINNKVLHPITVFLQNL